MYFGEPVTATMIMTTGGPNNENSNERTDANESTDAVCEINDYEKKMEKFPHSKDPYSNLCPVFGT